MSFPRGSFRRLTDGGGHESISTRGRHIGGRTDPFGMRRQGTVSDRQRQGSASADRDQRLTGRGLGAARTGVALPSARPGACAGAKAIPRGRRRRLVAVARLLLPQNFPTGASVCQPSGGRSASPDAVARNPPSCRRAGSIAGRAGVWRRSRLMVARVLQIQSEFAVCWILTRPEVEDTPFVAPVLGRELDINSQRGFDGLPAITGCASVAAVMARRPAPHRCVAAPG